MVVTSRGQSCWEVWRWSGWSSAGAGQCSHGGALPSTPSSCVDVVVGNLFPRDPQNVGDFVAVHQAPLRHSMSRYVWACIQIVLMQQTARRVKTWIPEARPKKWASRACLKKRVSKLGTKSACQKPGPKRLDVNSLAYKACIKALAKRCA